MFGVCHVLVLVVLFGKGFCLAWGRYRRRLGGAFGSVRRIGTLGQGYVQGVKQVRCIPTIELGHVVDLMSSLRA